MTSIKASLLMVRLLRTIIFQQFQSLRADFGAVSAAGNRDGTEELFAVRSNPYNYVHQTGIEFREGMDGGGGAPITAQMKKSGVYVQQIRAKAD